jgi:Uma2 family endonuclease
MISLTEEELLHLNLPGRRTELVRGQLIVREPAGFRHGVVAGRLYEAIARHVTISGFGVVVAAETGFTLFRDPDTVRAPDVGFVARERVPDPLPRGFAELAPDLAVEVLSPDDRAGEVLEKVADWLKAGCRLVWVVDPERRLARVYRGDGSEEIIGTNRSLGGEDVLPGFACPLTTIV